MHLPQRFKKEEMVELLFPHNRQTPIIEDELFQNLFLILKQQNDDGI